MVGNTIKRYDEVLYTMKKDNSSQSTEQKNDDFLSDNPVEAKIMIAMTLAFIVGLIQVRHIDRHVSFNLFESLNEFSRLKHKIAISRSS